jgi:hypothetical protein
MKRSVYLLAGLVCLFFSSVHADVGSRHIERAGGYSLQAPKGWEFREFPGMKYQIAFGQPKDAFAPNINVVDETYGGPLKTYVDLNLQSLEKLFVDFKLLRREAFVTASGVKGEKIIVTSLQQKNLLRQTFYFFPGPSGKYLVVTCSALAKGGEALDGLFAESLKTFELLK